MERTTAVPRVDGGRLRACALAALVIGGAAWCGDTLSAAPAEPLTDAGLDEAFTIRTKNPRFTKRVRAPEVFAEAADTLRRAYSRVVQGRPLVDRETGRVVQVDPGAIRDAYQVLDSLPFDKAQKKTDRLLRQLERTGRTGKLDALHARWLAVGLDPGTGGLRIDDPADFASFPPTAGHGGLVPDGAELSTLSLRHRDVVAGDDRLWFDYAVDFDVSAYPELRSKSEIQRFWHPVDPETGLADPFSRLRRRTYRQVVLNTRGRRFATYLPELPTTFEDERAGLVVDSEYRLTFPKRVARGVRSVKLFDGTKVPFSRGIAAFTTSAERTYTQAEARSDDAMLQAPRVINTTPPHRERYVDATTDWEDPDNKYTVPLRVRRTFVIRMRWSHALDPRTTNGANVRLTKVQQSGQPVSELVATNVDLVQRRLEDVTLEITPLANLDPEARYEVTIDGSAVTGLAGQPLGEDVRWWFDTE